MVLAVVSSLVGAGLVLPPAPATALSTGDYVRVSRSFAKVVPLRTRGYYPEDSCLFDAVAACKRPRATTARRPPPRPVPFAG